MATDQKAITLRDQNVEPRASKTKALWIHAGKEDLTADEARALALIGDQYDLDPALGEVMILGSKVYITLAGYEAVAHRDERFEGLETWPLSEEERKAGKIAADEHAWGCRVYRKSWRVPAVDWGIASERGIAMPQMRAFAREVAKARAVRRTLKLAFGLDLPDPDQAVFDTTTGEAVTQVPLVGMGEAEPKRLAIAPDWRRFWGTVKGWGLTRDDVHEALRLESVTKYDGSIAEALDVVRAWQIQRAAAEQRAAHLLTVSDRYEPSDEEWEGIPEGDATEVAEVEETPSAEPPSSDVPPTLIPVITNWGELYSTCYQEFHLSRTMVLKELGYRDQPAGLIDFHNAYAQIREVRRGQLA